MTPFAIMLSDRYEEKEKMLLDEKKMNIMQMRDSGGWKQEEQELPTRPEVILKAAQQEVDE